MHVEVPRVNYEELHSQPDGEKSQTVQARVLKARERQWTRLGEIKTNAEMNALETSEFCRLDEASEQLLKNVFERQHLSARSHDRILRVARTIADLDGEDKILSHHLAESLQFRALDKNSVY